MYVVEEFANWAVEARSLRFAPEVWHHARRAVIDWHAALYPGAMVAPATLLEKALADELDRGEARPRPGRKATARAAALIKARRRTRSRSTTSSATASTTRARRPSPPRVALAATGDFLRAVVVGYEISTRIGAAMGKAHYKHWHNTGTIGCFGAAAAAAEALELDRKQFAHALATVATFAAGLQQAFRMDSMSKPLHAGRAAEAGVTAALAAREGVTGSLDVMARRLRPRDGRQPGLGARPRHARQGLPHHAHDVQEPRLLRPHLRRDRRRARAEEAHEAQAARTSSRSRSPPTRPGSRSAHYEKPRTPAEGRFSLKYVVATALTHGSVRLAAFEPERLARSGNRAPDEEDHRSRSTRELDAAFPAQARSARRDPARAAGARSGCSRRASAIPTRRSPTRMLEEKYLELATPVLGEAKARRELARTRPRGDAAKPLAKRSSLTR